VEVVARWLKANRETVAYGRGCPRHCQRRVPVSVLVLIQSTTKQSNLTLAFPSPHCAAHNLIIFNGNTVWLAPVASSILTSHAHLRVLHGTAYSLHHGGCTVRSLVDPGAVTRCLLPWFAVAVSTRYLSPEPLAIAAMSEDAASDWVNTVTIFTCLYNVFIILNLFALGIYNF